MKNIIRYIICIVFINSNLHAQDNSKCLEYVKYAYSLKSKGQIIESIKAGEEACNICNKLGEVSIGNITALTNLAVDYFEYGDYSKGLPISIKLVDLTKKKDGKLPPDYHANALNILAAVYRVLGNYNKSEPLMIEAMEIRKKLFGENNLEYANSLHNLAGLYEDQGYLLKAQNILVKTIEIRKNLLGDSHPEYAVSLNNLAAVNFKLGDFQKSEVLNNEALKIRRNILGELHPDYAYSLYNLAVLYQKLGDFEKAKSYYVETINIRKKIFSENNIYYSEALNGLANLYLQLGNFDIAKGLYNSVLSIQEKLFGTEHISYATTLNNLSVVYLKTEKYDLAEMYLLNSIKIKKKILKEDHPDIALLYANLGVLYGSIAKYKESEYYLLKSIEISKKVAGKEYSDTHVLNNLAIIHDLNENFEKANIFFTQIISMEKILLKQNLSFLSSNQSANLLKLKLEQFERWNSFLIEYPKSHLIDSLTNFNYIIKGALIQNSSRLSNAAYISKDNIIIDNWLKYKSLKNQITNLSQLPIGNQINLKEIQTEAEKLEKQLMQQLPAFQEQVSKNNVRWQQVQASLAKNEASIEFVHFQYFKKRWTDSTFYAAFIIKPGLKSPVFLNIFEEKKLAQILRKANNEPDSTFINKLYSDNRLNNLIAKPLEKYLAGVKTIYLSPSGLLHKVNLAQIFGKKYLVRMLGNTGELPLKKDLTLSKAIIKNTFLFGGINYDKVNRSVVKPIEYSAGFDALAINDTRGGIDTWGYLNGTAEEILQIEKINRKEGINNISYSNTIASEENFKNISGTTTPFTIHLATHGYFFPDIVKEKPEEFNMIGSERKIVYKLSDDPLIRSGLILAGANKAWKSTKTMPDSTEDGILTSSEISNLDLSNCQLAVLSACETALGDIKGSEGVFGLQRGFKLAGVKNIIMSLWKIPDTQSAELLTLFYNNSYAGMPIHEALKQAQATMSKKYSPYNWAGFVLLE